MRPNQLELFPTHIVPMPAVSLRGDISALWDLCTTGQRFGTIYIDPPWSYANTATRAAATKHYETLSCDALQALPLAKLAMKRSHLFLWSTNAMMPQALTLLATWGFTYKTMLTWCKPEMGLGNYFRGATEQLVLGVKGSLPFRDHSKRSWFIHPRGLHSRKPDQVRRMIEEVGYPPYLEVFARSASPGWTVIGDGIEQTLFTMHERQKDTPHV